jgi:hypothetical protein
MMSNFQNRVLLGDVSWESFDSAPKYFSIITLSVVDRVY